MKNDDIDNKERTSRKVPENLTQAIVSLLWHSRWRALFFVMLGVLVIVFSIWKSLPDSTKESLLRRPQPTDVSEERKSEDAIQQQETTTGPVDRSALTVLSKHEFFFGAMIVPLAQITRASKHAVFVWPVNIVSGRIADDDIIGVTLLHTEGSYHVIRLWSYPERDKVEKELGGKDFIVRDRSAGVVLQELGPRFKVAWDSFYKAMKANNQSAAIEAGVAMSRLFALGSVVYDDGVAELLIAAFRMGPSYLSYGETLRDDKKATVVFWGRDPLRSMESQRIAFAARLVDEERNRWVLTEPVREK